MLMKNYLFVLLLNIPIPNIWNCCMEPHPCIYLKSNIFASKKKIVRIITFSNYQEHSNPLFKRLNLIKFFDLIFLHTAIYMHDFASNKLPIPLDNFFIELSKIHRYNSRLASKATYSLPRVRTNYGKFNIRFQGAKIWNSLDEETKASNRNIFKRRLLEKVLNSY